MGPVLTDWLREIRRNVTFLLLIAACVSAVAAGAKAIHHLVWTAPIEANLLAMRPTGLEAAVLSDWNCDCAPGPGGHEAALVLFHVDGLSTRTLAAAGWTAGPRDGAYARDWARKRGNPPFPDGVSADWKGDFWLQRGRNTYLANVTNGQVLMAFHD